MIILFVDNLFFYLGSQSVSCKASPAALRLYGYFCDFCFVFVSENKYDDDDEIRGKTPIPMVNTIVYSCPAIIRFAHYRL